MSDSLTSLVKQMDQQLEAAGKTERPLGVYVIFMTNADGLDTRLRLLAENEGLKRVNLCIGAPPKTYEVGAEADTTVVIYNIGRRPQQQVTANFALRKGELDDTTADAILKALADVLPR
jgi:hypothetical protein